MIFCLQIIFWACVAMILHTYLLYPIFINLVAKRRTQNTLCYSYSESLPSVVVLIAAYNEESTIEKKIRSVYATKYPLDLITVVVGSDNSTDKTNEIVETCAREFSSLRLERFAQRTGKPEIINVLCEKYQCDVFLLTDANVYFEEDTIFELVKHFKNPKISAVGSLIKNTNIKANGISMQEKTYLSGEFLVKYSEGLWGNAVIGLFGGLYAIRSSAYTRVPQGYCVDDFYITMKVIEQGGGVIMSKESQCQEDVSNTLHEEFRRKVRISKGNFMNLKVFKHLANPCTKVGFMFLSHKIFRWFTPFALIAIFLLNIALLPVGWFYQLLFAGQLFLLLLLGVDFFLKKCSVNVAIFRFVTHFYSMNLALLLGFINYKKGNDSNVWEPTRRNQD